MSPRFAWAQYRDPWTLEVQANAGYADLAASAAFEPPEVELDLERRRLQLDPESPWSTVELDFKLSTTETAPEDLDDPCGYVLISSTRTNTRIPILLRASDGHFSGSAVVERSVIGGAVELLAQVVDQSGRIVGAALPWAMTVDFIRAPTPPGAPPIECVWTDFSDADAPATLRAAKDSYSIMAFDQPTPILYLNTGVKGLQQILTSSSKNERRRLRDTLGTSIARQSLQALFREAQANVAIEDHDDDQTVSDVELPADPLLRQVCIAVADALDSVASPEQLFLELKNDQRRRQLSAELDHAFDVLTDHSSTVAAVVEEVLYAK